jgi:hypothetical protein
MSTLKLASSVFEAIRQSGHITLRELRLEFVDKISLLSSLATLVELHAVGVSRKEDILIYYPLVDSFEGVLDAIVGGEIGMPLEILFRSEDEVSASIVKNFRSKVESRLAQLQEVDANALVDLAKQTASLKSMNRAATREFKNIKQIERETIRRIKGLEVAAAERVKLIKEEISKQLATYEHTVRLNDKMRADSRELERELAIWTARVDAPSEIRRLSEIPMLPGGYVLYKELPGVILNIVNRLDKKMLGRLLEIAAFRWNLL